MSLISLCFRSPTLPLCFASPSPPCHRHIAAVLFAILRRSRAAAAIFAISIADDADYATSAITIAPC